MNYLADLIALKTIILSQNLTLTALSNKAGVSPVSLSKICNGGKCRTMTANKIATALGKPVTELFTVE